MGFFVGHSPDHASDVALVLNPRTGLVSPQYHVVFDDTFSTIGHLQSDNAPSNWHHLVENCCENYTDDPKDTKLIDEIANTLPTDTKFVKNKSAMEKCLDLVRNTDTVPNDDAPSTDLFIPEVDPDPKPVASEGAMAADNPVQLETDLIETPADAANPSSMDLDLLDLDTAGLRRSGRQRKPT